jgi:single-strand DNA-binding protein
MSINVVNLVGRVGRDPEVKYFDSGKVKCTFSLAVNRMTSRDEGPDWFELELWDKTAETAGNYVRKGKLIGIQGSLKFDFWTDKNTNAPRSRPLIRVDRLTLLGSKQDEENNSSRYDEMSM